MTREEFCITQEYAQDLIDQRDRLDDEIAECLDDEKMDFLWEHREYLSLCIRHEQELLDAA